ncbi:MAG: oligoendopeptidase F [Lachnospiraceae bacterium]|nr:oligoendopeptidase F [Lachnospiraceae bacterium]
MSDAVLKRDEIESKYKWAIEDIYESDELFLEDCNKLEKLSKEIEELEGTFGKGSEYLLKVFEKKEEINRVAEKVVMYANMKFHEDTSVSKYQGYAGKAQAVCAMADNSMSFIEPEILEMEESIIYGYLEENSKLKKYETYIKRLYDEKSHMLSKSEEAIIAKTMEISSAASDIYDVFSYSDIKFSDIHDENGEPVSLTTGRYGNFLKSSNRNVRKEAFISMYSEYKKYINTFAAMFLGNCKRAKFYADIRKYNNSLEYSLLSKRIPIAVYDNIIDVVNENIDKLHRYVSLRKKALGLDELHMYDIYVPMVEDIDKRIDFEEAKEMVLKGLAPMGEEYIENLKQGFNNRWIDVYENSGKRSGAYSWGPNGVHPYVLLNYQGQLSDVFTIAHEMGHALHSFYSDKTQDYIYAEYQIFVAEVASTCNEALLINYLLENCTDRKEKLYLINYFLECFKGTIYRQTMFAEFEKIVHEKIDGDEIVNVDDLNEIYLNLNKKYYGGDIISDDEISFEWARIPHFYNEFYVYQYATGFSAAIALSKRIMEMGDEGVRDYMKFLTGGSSKDPIELLKDAGVDMSSKEPARKALQLFGELLDEYEKIIAEDSI